MSYKKTIDELFNLQHNAIKLGLERIEDISHRFDNPERSYPVIHIAGSKGKGSTGAILSSILTSAGYKTGLFTSPHVSDYCERFKINGKKITHKRLEKLFREVYPEVIDSKTTFFETTAFLAFYYFQQEKVDFAVIEVGMGGRLDATNIVHPAMTIITEIDLEHKKTLGKTLKLIAGEKAGILKKNVPCVIGVSKSSPRKAILNKAESLQSPVYDAFSESSVQEKRVTKSGVYFDYLNGALSLKNAKLALTGRHQLKNTQVAIEAAKRLAEQDFNISKGNILSGLSKVRLEARIQHLSVNPPVIIDVCHTRSSAEALIDTIKKIYPGKRAVFIFGVMRDKDFKYILKILSPVTNRIYFIKPDHRRALETIFLEKAAAGLDMKVEVLPDIDASYRDARQNRQENEVIVCAGSFYFLDEIKKVNKTLDKENNSN